MRDGRMVEEVRHERQSGDPPKRRAATRVCGCATWCGSARSGCGPGRLRAFLSALGIAIGIAAMIAVVGISSSSRAELDRQLDALGTNLLTVAPGTS